FIDNHRHCRLELLTKLITDIDPFTKGCRLLHRNAGPNIRFHCPAIRGMCFPYIHHQESCFILESLVNCFHIRVKSPKWATGEIPKYEHDWLFADQFGKRNRFLTINRLQCKIGGIGRKLWAFAHRADFTGEESFYEYGSRRNIARQITATGWDQERTEIL